MRNTDTDTDTANGTTRLLRTKKRLSLDELGRRSGIERSRLCRYELGYIRLNAEELTRLAKSLGVRPAKLGVRTPRNAPRPATRGGR